MFSTDAAGSVEEEIAEESQGLLQEFVDYIKTHKVVVLEDLASNFGLRTEVSSGNLTPAAKSYLAFMIIDTVMYPVGSGQSCSWPRTDGLHHGRD